MTTPVMRPSSKLTVYEIARRAADPFLPPLHRYVRKMLVNETAVSHGSMELLDVGGRKSTYTIGVDANVTVMDLPRETELQHSLNLGADPEVLRTVRNRRSNIKQYLLADMTNSGLPGGFFDIAVSVEVLEHVEEDKLFVSEVSRVLKPGGVFVMSTPNGDFLENRNPDHKRHYKKRELEELLRRYFSDVTIDYAIAGGYFRKVGLRTWSLRHPARTGLAIFGNLVNSFQSSGNKLRDRAIGTHHLIAVARKDSHKPAAS